jgi:tripartite-type tricarboxylate transporter receptor subunit TctC
MEGDRPMRLRRATVMVVAVLTVVCAGAHAAGYPDHAVRIIVPTAPAGAIDATARALGAALSDRWGQPAVIDNRPGASMVIGTELAAKAAPDGYTLLVAHDGAMAMNVAAVPNLPYDPRRDFAPITLIATLPFVLMVNEGVPARSAEDLVELARKTPGKLNHASGGPAAEMAFALFKHMAGIDIVDVVYKGGALAVESVLAGETQLCLADIASANAGLSSPHARVLAVTSRERLARLPDAPWLGERAVPGYEYVVWIGLFAPAATPAPIIAKIEADARAALAEPGLRARLEALQMTVQAAPAPAFKQRLDADIEKWVTLVRETGLKLR